MTETTDPAATETGQDSAPAFGSVTPDDLRAGVSAGTITEAQAASLLTLARNREAARAGRAVQDEPFELFRGFNEVFIVVGLAILFSGYVALTEVSVMFMSAVDSGAAMVWAALGAVLVTLLTAYFTLRRRMVGPSIALALGMAYFAFRFGFAVDQMAGWDFIAPPICAALVLMGYWVWARIPFTLLLIVAALLGAFFATAIGLSGAEDVTAEDLFLISSGGIYPFITLGLGLASLAAALYFDLQDRYRVTRATSNGFWLHVAAAPMIMNPIAASLFGSSVLGSNLVLLIFVLVMAAVAIVIDRRSFLLSGIGYLIALIVAVLDGGWGLAILVLGLLLITLGAQWERIRCALLERLPDFPGKSRLPPWTAKTGTLT